MDSLRSPHITNIEPLLLVLADHVLNDFHGLIGGVIQDLNGVPVFWIIDCGYGSNKPLYDKAFVENR